MEYFITKNFSPHFFFPTEFPVNFRFYYGDYIYLYGVVSYTECYTESCSSGVMVVVVVAVVSMTDASLCSRLFCIATTSIFR